MTQASNITKKKIKRAAIYCHVSTDDQTCDRELRDLQAFAARAGYEVIATFVDKAVGGKDDRPERAKILAMAQARKIDVILVTELTSWGKSTIDLLSILRELHQYGVSVIAQTGNQFDMDSAPGRIIARTLSALSQFEGKLITKIDSRWMAKKQSAYRKDGALAAYMRKALSGLLLLARLAAGLPKKCLLMMIVKRNKQER